MGNDKLQQFLTMILETPHAPTPGMPKDFQFAEIPDKPKRTRSLNKEMQNAQATLKLHAGQSAVVKVCKTKASAYQTALNMSKSPNWKGFKVDARDVRVFATYIESKE